MELRYGANEVIRDHPFICYKCKKLVKANTKSITILKANSIGLSYHIKCKTKEVKK
jgi:hypothetical protein